MAERNRLIRKIYTKTADLSMEELIKMLRTERNYINRQIKKLTKLGLSSSSALHYKTNPISLSNKLSYQQIRKEVLKAKSFFTSKDWTVEGAKEYTAERKLMYEHFSELVDYDDTEFGFEYGEQLASRLGDLYEDIMAQFPSHLRKILESDQESILEEIEEELKYSKGVSYDEIFQKLHQSAYDRIGDFFSSSSGGTKLHKA